MLAHLSRQASMRCTSSFMLCRWRSELEAARTLETEEKYRQYAGTLSGHLQACEAILSQVSWAFWEQKKPALPRTQLLRPLALATTLHPPLCLQQLACPPDASAKPG